MKDLIEFEKELLLQGEVSDYSIRSKLEGMSDEDTTPGFDSQVSDEFKKCRELAETFGESVFKVDDDSRSIRMNESFKAKQEYMLCLSSMLTNDEGKMSRISRLFEKVVGKSVKSYLGDPSKCRKTDPLSGTDIKRMCEEELYECPQAIPSEEKELLPRCDLIAWKPFSKNSDKRPGKLVLLIQCKAGRKWRHGQPVNINNWKQSIINFATTPVQVYAITDMIDKKEILQWSHEKGIIFDRVRVVSQLACVDDDEIKRIREEIEKIKPNEDLEQ